MGLSTTSSPSLVQRTSAQGRHSSQVQHHALQAHGRHVHLATGVHDPRGDVCRTRQPWLGIWGWAGAGHLARFTPVPY